jgi:TIR domain-containing protein
MNDRSPSTAQPWMYDVALSFAGEDRHLALELATRLHACGHSVFFDRFEELWGQDLADKLHDVYSKQSRYCVVLVSRHYLEKPWTNHERRILLARSLNDASPFLLPVRVDGSELPGLPGVIAYKDLRIDSLDEIFRSLRVLLEGQPTRVVSAASALCQAATIELVATDFLYAVVHADTPDIVRFNLAYYLVNNTAQGRELHRLEATLRPQGDRDVHLVWSRSVDIGVRYMQPAGDELPMSLAVGQSRLAGAQFSGPSVRANSSGGKAPMRSRSSAGRVEGARANPIC